MSSGKYTTNEANFNADKDLSSYVQTIENDINMAEVQIKSRHITNDRNKSLV